ERRELRGNVQAEWLDAMSGVAGPALHALHQVSAGATDVEEPAVAVDGVGDERAGARPMRLVATLTGLAARVIRGEILRRDDRGDGAVPPVLIDPPRRQIRLGALEQIVRAVFAQRDGLGLLGLI